MERNNNVLKVIDVTQYMLFESSGDSDVKSDLNSPCAAAGESFSNFGCGQNGYNHDNGNDDDDDDDDDDDAESCSYDSSYGECVDGFCPDYRDRKGFVNKRDGSNDYNHFRRSARDEDDDEMEEDGDAIDSKLMVEEEEELPQKKKKKKKNDLCTDFVMGRRQNKRSSKDHYCSSMEFLNNQKETDKNFWDTCLAS